ncbi:MAG: SAM-dependent methyltransferase [Bacteriovoracaceae bacterium]
MKGELILIPTPISEDKNLHQDSIEAINQTLGSTDEVLFVVEEHKIARRRWIKWGLERSLIDQFIIYNEQTWHDEVDPLIEKLKKGFKVFIQSDGGLPGLFDPGRELIFRSWENGVNVTSLNFDNSVVLALTLSGFRNTSFEVKGFIPRKADEREKFWKQMNSCKQTAVIMDTPYRLSKVIQELQGSITNQNRLVYIGCNLNTKEEFSYWGTIKSLKSFSGPEKANFVLCLSQ